MDPIWDLRQKESPRCIGRALFLCFDLGHLLQDFQCKRTKGEEERTESEVCTPDSVCFKPIRKRKDL